MDLEPISRPELIRGQGPVALLGIASAWGPVVMMSAIKIKAWLEVGCVATGLLISISSLLLLWFPHLRPRRTHPSDAGRPTP